MKTPNIVVVGSSNTDMVVESSRLPGPGETVTGGRFVMAAGGKGANQAVAAARLGARVALIAKTGGDMFGDRAIEGYQQEGIATDGILRDPDSHTGVALILVDQQGENLISVASGANHRLTAEDVDREADRIRQADVLLLQLEIPLEAVERAAEIAAAGDTVVILDPAPAPDQPLSGSLLQRVDFLTPNETEAERLTGVAVRDEASARAAAAKLLENGPRCVIITMGAKGSLAAQGDQAILLPAPRIQARDTTAAGDAFNGGLACAVARGLALPDAVREASLVGALSATQLGAQPSLPTADQLQQFAESLGGPSSG